MRICSVDGCDHLLLAKGLCSKHYNRLKNNGSVSIIKIEKHGMKNTSEYVSWIHMKGRCFNKNDAKYPRYGQRGITVCDRWRYSFIAFYEDMGPKPFLKAQIDRIDNDGNYEPENCHWVKNLLNARNKSTTKMTFDKAIRIRELSKTMQGTEIAKLYNISNSTVYDILKYRSWRTEV